MNLCKQVWYESDTNTYLLQAENGTCIRITPEALGKARYQTPTETKMNKGWKNYSEGIEERYNNFLRQAQAQNKMDTTMNNFGLGYNQFSKSILMSKEEPVKMKRLTTSGDWTILLEANKLVAVNSEGVTIRATSSFLSADGKAWMWKDGKLWSGTLEEHETEEGKRKRIEANIAIKTAEKRAKILKKRDEAVRAAHKKYNRLLNDA